MQKQKLTHEFFLAIQATYDTIEIALFDKARCIDTIQENKMLASRNFISLLACVLSRNQISVEDLNFITVNQGPGLFSALRSIIVSANGLSFARHIPLIGVDGLKALLCEHTNPAFPITIALLNAFNNEVYFAIEDNNEIIATGYNVISAVLDRLYLQYRNCTVRFIGNGTELYYINIVTKFLHYAYIPASLPCMVSITHVGLLGLKKWQRQECTNQLFPLYLKQHPAQAALEKNASDPLKPV